MIVKVFMICCLEAPWVRIYANAWLAFGLLPKQPTPTTMYRTRWIVPLALAFSITAQGQDDPTQEKAMDLYGFAMMDFGYNAGAIHPDWFDVMRPTKLPSFKDEFGSEGNMYFSVRQSRLGVKSYTNTA